MSDRFEEYEDELTPEEVQEFKVRLEQERESIKQRLSERISEMQDDERPADELDQAGKLSDQAFMLRLADKERKLLNQIELALRKIAEDDYGYCEGTGEPISKKRLELRPWTRYSIEYKEELERRKKQGLR